jgi:hypothetical protein
MDWCLTGLVQMCPAAVHQVRLASASQVARVETCSSTCAPTLQPGSGVLAPTWQCQHQVVAGDSSLWQQDAARRQHAGSSSQRMCHPPGTELGIAGMLACSMPMGKPGMAGGRPCASCRPLSSGTVTLVGCVVR